MDKMTREEKLVRLFEMQEHPERFTDDELQAMLDDEDIREDIIIMRKIRMATRKQAKTSQAPHVVGCVSSPVGEEVTVVGRVEGKKHTTLVDRETDKDQAILVGRMTGKNHTTLVDRETDKDQAILVGREAGKKHTFSTFVEKLTSPHMGGLGGLSRLAAAFIGCILLAGITYAAIRIVQERTPMPIAETQTANVVEDNAEKTANIASTETIAQSDSTVTFDNEELATVLTAMSEHYNIKVAFENEQAKHIRLFLEWNKHQPITEIVAMLNKYDRINIKIADNTLTVK